MINWKVVCVTFTVMAACNGYGVNMPVAEAAAQFSAIADKYLFRDKNIEQEWFKQLTNFVEKIDQAIAKMPTFGPSKLSKTNKDLIGAGKQFTLEFSTLLFDALKGNKDARKKIVTEYLKLDDVSDGLKPKTSMIGGDASKTVEIKRSLQRVLEILKKMYCHFYPTGCI